MPLPFGLNNDTQPQTGSSPSSLPFGLGGNPTQPLVPQPTKQPILQSFNSPMINSGLNTVKSTVGAFTDTLSQPIKQSFNPLKWGKAVIDSYDTAINDASQKLSSAFSNWSTDSRSQKVNNVGQAGVGILNSLFAPISAAFQGAETIPGVGYIARGINSIFAGISGGSSQIGLESLDSLPIPQKIKDNLAPFVSEASAFAGQIIAGKAGAFDVVPKLHEYTNKILDGIKGNINKETVNSISESVKKGNNLQTVKPTDLIDYVDNSLLKNEVGVREKSLKYFEENPDKITEKPIKIREVDGHLTIEDGRHRLEVANNLGIKNLLIEDVTPEYTGQKSTILPQIGKVQDVAPVEGTGKSTPRGLSVSVEEKAVANNLTKTLGDLPEYKKMDISEQARLSTELIKNDYEKAKRVAMGDEPAPHGIYPEAAYTAVVEHATKQGDVNTIRELAVNSKLTTEATTMGQRIRLLGEINPDSPIDAIRSISNARETMAEKRSKGIPKAKKALIEDGKKEMDKVKPKKQDWASFIRSIQC